MSAAWFRWFAVLVALSGCTGAQVPTATPAAHGPKVVSFEGGGVSVAELQAHVAQLPATERARLDPASLRAAADDLGVQALLAAEARRRGLDRDPEVVAMGSKVMQRRLLQLVVEDPALNEVTDADIAQRLAELADGGPSADGISRPSSFDRRPDQPLGETPKSSDELRRQLRQALVDERRRARYDALIRKLDAEIQFDEAALAAYRPPADVQPDPREPHAQIPLQPARRDR
jgi:hypothetical protein